MTEIRSAPRDEEGNGRAKAFRQWEVSVLVDLPVFIDQDFVVTRIHVNPIKLNSG